MHTRIRSNFRLLAIISLLALVGSLLSPVVPVQAQAQEFPPECPWMDTTKSPEERARLLLDASTLDQKMRWLNEQAANNPTQTTFNAGGGQTAVYPVQVPCTPVIQYTDGPAAISGGGTGVTAFPGQTALSATWDLALAQEKGLAHGAEAFGKHRNVVLGPGIASGRDPRSGRTSEYLGEDPLLAGLMAAAHVRGIQDNPAVESVIKHYVANEQEIDRNRSSSNVDARTLREIYTLPFEIAIREGNPGGIMCAFNQVNHVYSCENAEILDQILRNEIGFEGWVVTDFGAIHSLNSTPPSLVAGLDQELNRPRFWSPVLLHAALDAGLIAEEQIDRAAFRVVRAHIANGLFDTPLPDAPADVVTTPEHQALARRIAEEGAVLLKNDGILPLGNPVGRDHDRNRCGDKRGPGCPTPEPITIAVIGPTASNTPVEVLNTYGGGGFGPPSPTVNVSAASVCAYTAPSVPCTPVAPLDGITARAAQDGSTVLFNNGSDLVSAATTAADADVAIVFGYYRSGEFTDRPHLSLDHVSLTETGDALIAAVAAANPNTVVVLQTGGPVLMPWLDNVKAVLEVWYAGEQMGPAIAALLWGDVNPSGKLPHTFPASETDLPTAGSPEQYPGLVDGSTTRPPGNTSIRQVEYLEGLLVGYRWYDAQGIEPLFPFGFGQSYTTFEYSRLQVTPTRVQSGREIRVKFRVTNTGPVTGTEIAQVYISLPAVSGEPPKRLVGWARVTLEPGERQNVTVTIDPNSSAHPLSYWSTDADGWVTAPGTYTVVVGSSSHDLPLEDTVKVRVK
jgi:beta-glucosidase